MPHGPDKASGKGFGVRRKISKTAVEIKEENEEVEEEKCVASTSAEVEGKVRVGYGDFSVCLMEFSLHLEIAPSCMSHSPIPSRMLQRRTRLSGIG